MMLRQKSPSQADFASCFLCLMVISTLTGVHNTALTYLSATLPNTSRSAGVEARLWAEAGKMKPHPCLQGGKGRSRTGESQGERRRGQLCQCRCEGCRSQASWGLLLPIQPRTGHQGSRGSDRERANGARRGSSRAPLQSPLAPAGTFWAVRSSFLLMECKTVGFASLLPSGQIFAKSFPVVCFGVWFFCVPVCFVRVFCCSCFVSITAFLFLM